MDSSERASKKAKTAGIGGELKGEATEAKGDEAATATVAVVGLHGSPEPLARVSTVPLLLGAGGEQNCFHCGLALDRSLAGNSLSCDMCARLLHVSCATSGTLCHGCQLGLRAAGGFLRGVLAFGEERRAYCLDARTFSLFGYRGAADVDVLSARTSTSLLDASLSLRDTAISAWIGNRKENQDVAFVADAQSICKIYGVFDGHGSGGELAAQSVAPQLLGSCALNVVRAGPGADPVAATREGFLAGQRYLLELLESRGLECGSTAILGLAVGNTFVCANVGDSRAVLVRNQPEAQGWVCVPLSRDHSFSREDECARIKATSKGEIILGAGGLMRVVPGGGFPKIEIQKRSIALAMTRSLGHPVLSQYGVSPEPEFTQTEIRPGDRIIMASDGLWDVMENEEVALVCSYRASANKCAQALLAAAREKYQKHKQRQGKADNTTIVCIYVEAAGVPSPPPNGDPSMSRTPSLPDEPGGSPRSSRAKEERT